MTVNFNGREYIFRECDTKGKAVEEVAKRTNKFGVMRYEPNGHVWLYVPGIGYAWEK